MQNKKNIPEIKGIIIASIITLLWIINLLYSLFYVPVSFSSVSFYFHFFLQTYFYTGLFITAHDAMHGTVTSFRKINNLIGIFSSFLYAGMSYSKLRKNHNLHHSHPAEISDPDFSFKTQNFFVWFFLFFYRYTSVMQFIYIAVMFNLLKIWFNEISVWFYFIIPVILSSLQLFYFGTYRPHRPPYDAVTKPYNARTMKKNHFLALILCYFFGYHWEHHKYPYIPWWGLYKTK